MGLVTSTVRSVLDGAIVAGLAMLPPRVRLMVLARAPIVARMDYSGHDIRLHVDSEFEYRIRLHSCRKEPDTVRWIESFSNGDVFYDIGANVGAYSLVAAARFSGRVSVYAFEPSALNFNQLVRNVALNHCSDTVTAFQLALSDVTGVVAFNYRSLVPGAALHSLGAPVDEGGRSFVPALRQSLIAYRLDDSVHRFNLPTPAHIKIDVDGGEGSVLAGACETLRARSLRSVLLEAGSTEKDALISTMTDCGLTLEATYPLEAGAANLLFVRKSA